MRDVLVSSLALMLILGCGCASRTKAREVLAAERAEVHREAAQMRVGEQRLTEDVICEEAWGSSGSPTTFHRLRLSRRVRAEDQERQTDTSILAHTHHLEARQQTKLDQKTWWQPYKQIIIAFALGVCLTYYTMGLRRSPKS